MKNTNNIYQVKILINVTNMCPTNDNKTERIDTKRNKTEIG